MKKLLIVLGMIVLMAGCSSTERVGDASLLKKLKSSQSSCRLGQCSPSPSPTAPRVVTSKKPTHPASAAPATSVRTWTIRITAEGFEGVESFNPANFNVCRGDKIRFVNADTQARGATAEKHFDTKTLQPGGAFVYTTAKVESFNFTDHDRPFVVGKVNVVVC